MKSASNGALGGYISKPFEEEELYQAISRSLVNDRSQLDRSNENFVTL
jgi:FixJ family two-component response regulator